MPLTEEQRRALPELRAHFSSTEVAFGSSMPFDKRASLPTSGLPDDITARVEIAPPLSTPLLDDSVLKEFERVPIFYYNPLQNNGNSTSALPEDTKVIFYIHGGGNVVGHPTDALHIHLFSSILRAAIAESGGSVPITVIAPCYRLATVVENRFPAALQDLLAAYDHVIGQGYKPSSIVIAGDSAGGNHAVVLTHLILHSSRSHPNGVFVFAPASIQTSDYMSDYAKAQASVDIIPLPVYKRGWTAYIDDTGFAPTDQLISGSFISFTETWPRTLILFGTGDLVVDASRELVKRLTALNRPVEVVEYDELPHEWWLFLLVFPEEIRTAAQRIARFVLRS